jgi:hypothetical protein
VHALNDELRAAFQRWYPKFGTGQKAQRSTPKWILSMLVQEGAWSSYEYQQWLSDTLVTLVRS